MLSYRIVGHRFDHRKSHALRSKILQRVFDESPTNATTAFSRIDSQIGDTSFPCFLVDSRRDVA
jgi:hypothetical protein